MDTTAGSSEGESDGEGLGDTELWLEQVRCFLMLDVLHCAVQAKRRMLTGRVSQQGSQQNSLAESFSTVSVASEFSETGN